ncbi:MAG: MBL fold metallo-hydrolase [Alphaproteobacteria bacterium]|nr:MBL fold metallo-hydrolase [Alphaproteobacteria bacterium]
MLVRGWLHGNVVALAGDAPAVVDSGYATGADALLGFAGRCEVLALTHAHSDHAGGAAALVGRFGCPVLAHRDVAGLVERWDPRELWLEGTGQELPRFRVDRVLGDRVELAGEAWHVVETPGHAVGGVSFFRERDGVLITGDALWEDGFGLLNPWYDPPGVLERTALALDALAELTPSVVIPGHGEPFTDFAGALSRARGRLAHLAAGHPAGSAEAEAALYGARNRALVLRNLLGFWRLLHPDATDAEVAAQRAVGEATLAGSGVLHEER